MKSWMSGVSRSNSTSSWTPGLMYRQRAIGLSDKAQQFGRITIEQCTQPAPSKVSGRGSRDRPCDETAVLESLAAAARAGVIAGRFHLPVSRVGLTRHSPDGSRTGVNGRHFLNW